MYRMPIPVDAWPIYKNQRSLSKHRGWSDPHEMRAVVARDGLRCEYCGSTDNLVKDHIIPFSHGGANKVTNYRPLCGSCNGKRSNKPLEDENFQRVKVGIQCTQCFEGFDYTVRKKAYGYCLRCRSLGHITSIDRCDGEECPCKAI